MAIIKAVSSKASIRQALNYVMKEEKTEEKLLSGKDCHPESVKDEMEVVKLLWEKTGGRTYKHFVQSFHKDENLIPEQAHEIAEEFVGKCPQFKDFQVLIATHKDREHIHTHFIVNSVSYEDGHKFNMHKSELQQMKDLSDQLCSQIGLHTCEKGKTFEQTEREETVAYTKETYQILKKAERGEVKSYVQDIAASVLDCREQATSREDFIQKMNENGYGVDWQDNHKYITFTDITRQEHGEKQCKIRNNKLEKYYNMDFSKEELDYEFEVNARSKKTRKELTDDDRGKGSDDIGAFVTSLNVEERASTEERNNNIAQRIDRETERKRHNITAEHAAGAAEQTTGENRKPRPVQRPARSRDDDWER